MPDVQSLLPSSAIRHLADKLYEKRKAAAVEIEGVVRQLVANGDHERITSLIKYLQKDFVSSKELNHRLGGLIGLAGVTIGLASEATQHLEQILPPILEDLSHPEVPIRYCACESLYNIAKVTRGDIIPYFNKLFDALCKLSADLNADVQRAAHLLDRLIKDIVTESDQFSIEEFIGLLRPRIAILNAHVRQFLMGWINVLDSVPDIGMVGFLPDFLDGLFNMLSDNNHETRKQANTVLSDFLLEIKSSPSVSYGQMTEILVQWSQSPDAFTRLTTVKWMNEFINLGGEQLLPYYGDILGSILLLISDTDEDTKKVAKEANKGLRAIQGDSSMGFNVVAVLGVAKSGLESKFEATRLESLQWISFLLQSHRTEVLSIANVDKLCKDLFECLSDPSDEVVLLALKVLSCIAKYRQHFHQLMVFLVNRFRNDHSLLQRRGSLILKRLCILLDAESIYRELANILEGETDLEFAVILVQALNMILLTASELADLRSILKKPLTNAAGGGDLFHSLHSSWCHSPMAILSLCLLAQAYQQACLVIGALAEEDMTVKLLVELDKLVRLLETPVFTFIRLQLLEPGKYMALLKALNSLLMLLPQQSAAFKILRGRLKTVQPPYMFMQTPSISNRELVGGTAFWWGSTNPQSSEEKNIELNNGNMGVNQGVQLFEHRQTQHRLYQKEKIERQKNMEKSSCGHYGLKLQEEIIG